MTSINGKVFWQFSLDYYAKVQPICLAWQDNFNANINLLLLLCYLEQQQLTMNSQTLNRLSQVLSVYNTRITQRVRLLRRRVSHLKPLNAEQQQFSLQLKKQLLAVELVAEQQEQQLLVQSLTANANNTINDKIINNPPNGLLELYLNQLQQPLSSLIQHQLLQLRHALSHKTITNS